MKMHVSRINIIAKLRMFIVSWWLLWLLVAALLYGGLSLKVYALVLFSMLGFYLGSFPFFPRKEQREFQHSRVISSVKFPFYGLSLIIAYQLNLFYKSYGLVDELGAGFREAYFDSVIHGSSEAFVLYEQFLVPIGIFLISLWVCRKKNGGWWFIYTTVFFILDAAIKAGRFPLYYYLFFLGVGHLLGTFRLRFIRIMPILVALPVFSVYQLLSRKSFLGETDTGLLTLIFEKAVLQYHICGFYILDNLMDRPDLNTHSIFPFYTFGYFQYILSLILRRIGISIEYPQQNLNIALTEVTYIDPIGPFNAFSTNILPLYLDGGFIFSFLMFYLLGFLLRSGSGSAVQPLSPINIIAAFVMVFGIFQPVVITGYFFIPIIMYVLIDFFSLDAGSQNIISDQLKQLETNAENYHK